MNGLLKLAPDVPVEIALSCADGVNVLSPRGTPAVKYNLVDGRIFFATTYVAAKLRNLKIEAHERIALCMRNIDGKSITLVERVPAPESVEANPPATSTVVDVTVINQETEPDPEVIPPPTDENDPSPATAQQNGLRDGSANEEQTSPISQLERALKTAIVPVQREMERERSPLVSIPPLWGGDFQGMGVYRSDVFLGRARKANFRAQQHRLDEPTRLSLGMVASLQSPLPFHLAMSL